VTGSRQNPCPPVEAPLPAKWEIWLLDEEIVVVGDEQGVPLSAAHHHVGTEREAFDFLWEIRTMALGNGCTELRLPVRAVGDPLSVLVTQGL
jgi:hypothetical protein